ncbi:MAG: hypothetical protein DME04_19085 [Candidatus Rokuibacteriota bacterium]|nr:MAG: hypothetical protein DME04_19085 [Candidatus Rokubacteria bacterium]
MKRRIVHALGALTLAMASTAAAEPQPRPAPPTAIASTIAPSPFAALSPGNRRIAVALFESQNPTAPSARPMTLEQIAQERRSGKTWNVVFQAMKSQGLIQAETLAQALGRHDRARHSRS